MSCVFGIIDKKGREISQKTIINVNKTLIHRSIDGKFEYKEANTYFWQDKSIAFSAKLSNFDSLTFGDLVIVADISLHNRKTIFSQLNLSIQQSLDLSDVELIYLAYQKWGEDCIRHFEGEYVFAIWNKISRQLFMGRDQFGFRPVYYCDTNDQFIFCSEIKGVLAAKNTPNVFNAEHLINYHFKQSNSDQTYNKEIFALCAANILQIKNGNLNITKYWQPKSLGKYHFTKDEDWFECLKELMYRAVEKRLDLDVPIGITLSGGLDSTSIACILSEILAKKNKPLYAFSSVLPIDHTGIEQDERKYIELVNNHCPNIIQTYIEAPGKNPFSDIKEAFKIAEVIPNCFFYMDIAILEAAKEKNIKTLFNGFGGDFWVSFKGTAIYELILQKEYAKAFRLAKEFQKIQHKNVFNILKSEVAVHSNWYKKLKELIKPSKNNWQEKSILKPEFMQAFPLNFPFEFDNNKTKMMDFIEKGRIGNFSQYFTTLNANFGISNACPLLDKDILEFLMDIPSDFFNYGGHKRSLIRHAMQGVIPETLQWRKDKLPYSPGNTKRVMQNMGRAIEILNSEEYGFVFDKYFSKELFLQKRGEIKPFKGFSSKTSVLGLRMVQAIISAEVLHHLKKEGNNFN